jgi:site-specific DNA-cytosine methylase
VLKACGLKAGELDVLDGSPPCQAFSTAGKREKGWGKDRAYEHGAKQKNEDLFFEFIRLRDGIMPRTFVAENVSGLVKGAAKGYFLEILRELARLPRRGAAARRAVAGRPAGAPAHRVRRRARGPRARPAVPGAAAAPLQRARRAAVDRPGGGGTRSRR